MAFHEKSWIRSTLWPLSNHPECSDRLETARNERIGVSTFSRYPVLICHDRWQKSCGRSKTPGRGRKSSKSLFSDQYLALSFKMCPEPVKSVNHKLCIFLTCAKSSPDLRIRFLGSPGCFLCSKITVLHNFESKSIFSSIFDCRAGQNRVKNSENHCFWLHFHLPYSQKWSKKSI